MTESRQNEYAIALWKSETSSAARLSVDEMRRRADLLESSFRGTAYIPWLVAALIVLGSSIALILGKLPIYRVAGFIGIVAGIYLALAARRLISRTSDAKAKCIDAYKFQLEQQRDSLKVCGTTFLLVAAACALGNVPLGAFDLRSIAWMVISASPGVISYAYTRTRVARFQRRIEEVESIARA